MAVESSPVKWIVHFGPGRRRRNGDATARRRHAQGVRRVDHGRRGRRAGRRPSRRRRRSPARPSAATRSSAPACARLAMWGRPILRDYPDLVEIVGLCDINPLRVEVAKQQMGATCPTYTNFDDMLTQGEAGRRDGDDRRRLPQPVSRPGDGARRRRHDREADGHRRGAVPRRARRREEDRPQDRRHAQLPLRAEAPEDQGTADGRRDRQDHVGRFHLVPRHHARRRLLPALAPAAREERLALGAQGVAPLRPGQLVDRRRAGAGLGARQPRQLREERPVPAHELPHLPAQGQLFLLLGHQQEPGRSSSSTTSASRRTAISATAASSRKTSTSSTR